MLAATKTRKGQDAFVGTGRTLNAITEWARSVCHLAFGPEEGERRFRQLPARDVLSLWANRA